MRGARTGAAAPVRVLGQEASGEPDCEDPLVVGVGER